MATLTRRTTQTQCLPSQACLNRAAFSLMHAVLISISIFMMLPFVWMVSTSFKPQTEIFARPPILISRHMSLDGYEYIYDYKQSHGVLNVLKNTVAISALVHDVLSLFFCALGGYGFAKYRFPGRKSCLRFCWRP